MCCQRCSKTKYEPTMLVLKETADNGEWYRRNGVVHVTSQQNYATISLSSDWKKTQGEKQNDFVISSFILVKRAAKWQLLTLLFRKNEDENKLHICDFSRYFSRKEKKSVANATVLVAISSPESRQSSQYCTQCRWVLVPGSWLLIKPLVYHWWLASDETPAWIHKGFSDFRSYNVNSNVE